MQAPAVRWAAPAQMTKVTITVEDQNWTTSLTGTSPEFFDIRNWVIDKGSLFADTDLQSGAKVIVVGATVADKLFGAGVDPVGKTVRIRAVPFLIVGLLQRKGQSPMGTDYDDAAFIPVSTFQNQIQGGLQNYIAGIVAVSAISADDTVRAQREITALLRDRHHLALHDDDDFNIRNLTEMANAQQEGTQALTALLAAIAAVSLVVGGIGIMNIMLVSVTERTREIGVRMAVGAKPWHVLAQFLAEAVTLSMIGGLLGIVIGSVIARVVASRLGWAYSPADRHDPAVLRVQRAGGRGVRAVPGEKGGAARTDRGAAVRVMARGMRSNPSGHRRSKAAAQDAIPKPIAPRYGAGRCHESDGG